MFKNISHCRRCGTCCKKGGPALHHTDKHFVLSGHIGYHQMTTIRKGEPAFTPLTGKIEPVLREFVKVSGKGKEWVCCLFDETESSCTIYKERPLECRLLKCWDTADLIAVIGKDTITRFDIIGHEDPVLKVIKTHEDECSAVKFETLVSVCLEQTNREDLLAELTELVRNDLAIRSRAISEFGLTLSVELFFFGRPLFKLLGSRGISVSVQESDGNIRLNFDSSLRFQA